MQKDCMELPLRYATHKFARAIIEQQMVVINTDGLTDNAVATEVMQEGLTSFQNVVQVAMQEEKLSRTFEHASTT